MKLHVSAFDVWRFSLIFGWCWLSVAAAIGAQRTWDGGGNDWDWRTAVNWDGSIIRPNDIDEGDTLVFPAGPTKLLNTNDFGPNTNFTALIYSGSGYNSYGNSIGLSNGISVTHASGTSGIFLPLLLRDDQSFTVSSASATLILGGDINIGLRTLTFDGAGNFLTAGEIINAHFVGGRNSVVKDGTGRLTILQATGHDVPTIVNGGVLAIEQRMTNSAVTVNAGGTVRGSSRLGPLTANSGGIVQPGGTTPDALECYGDVNLAAGSILRLRLNGSSAGTTYDQLQVNGTVTLGGTLEITLGFAATAGDTFTIIDNDGSDDIVGTFAGLPEGAEFTANGRLFKIRYGRFGGPFGRANDVTLEVLPGTGIWDGEGNLNKFWSEPLNWVGNVVPFPGDNVQFTATGPELRTVNDFAAGHAIGMITFIGGDHRAEGTNLSQIFGGIQVNTSATESGGVPRFLEVAMPLKLGADQTFAVNFSNAVLFTEAPIDLGDFDLTLETYVNYFWGSTANGQVTIRGGITGAGTLIKNGPGHAGLVSPSTCAHTIVNQGRFFSSGSSSTISGNVTVNSGGVFDPAADVYGNIRVNAGGVLTKLFNRAAGNVLIDGGTFARAGGRIHGDLRMINGAQYHVLIGLGSPNFPFPNGATVSNTVELGACDLVVDLNLSEPLAPGSLVSVLSHTNNGRSGIFSGLPNGKSFVVEGRVFTIQYQARDVVLIADLPFAWSGAAAGNFWSTPGNWTGNFAPISGVPLRFPANTTERVMTNDLSAQVRFSSLTFETNGYTLYGNGVTVTSILANAFATGQTTVNAPVALPSPAVVVVDGNSVLRLDGSVSSGAVIDKLGTGRLRLGGPESNTIAELRVLAGGLELAKTGASAITSRLQIGDGTSPAFASLLNNDQIVDNATVEIAANSRFETGRYSDEISRLQGPGVLEFGESLFPGGLTVSGGNFAGNIVGRGTLTKVSLSTLTLSGTISFTGDMILGPLRIDSSVPKSIRVPGPATLRVYGSVTGPVYMDGGLIDGQGTVGSIISNPAGGIVAPGSGSADFHNALRSGDINMNAATAFRPTLTSDSPGYENTYLEVSGTVNLGNARLNLTILGGFVPPTNKTFVILVNDGTDPVVGTFAGLPEGALLGIRGFAFRISYVGGTGNEITVTRVPAPPADFNSIQALGNGQFLMQGEALNGLEYNIQATPNLNPVINWTQVGRSTGNSSGIFQFIHSNSPAIPMRFYRAVTP